MTVIFLKDFSNLHGEATFEYSICVVFQTDAAKLGEKNPFNYLLLFSHDI